MGKQAAKASQNIQQQAADRYSKMAEQFLTESTPQRNLVGNYYSGIIKGGPEAHRVAAPEVAYMKKQFASARDGVRDYMPAGGQKTRAYRDLAVQQPGAISGVFQKKIEDALARLSNLATGSSQGALSANQGLSGSGAALGQLAAARGQAVGSAIGGLANLAGFGLGGGFSSGSSKGTT